MRLGGSGWPLHSVLPSVLRRRVCSALWRAGYFAPVLGATVVSAVATVMCLWLPEPEQECPKGPEDAPAVAQVLGQQHKRCDRPDPSARSGVLTQPTIVWLLVATLVLFLAFNLFYAGFPVHAQSVLGWDAARLGLFFALMSAAMIVAQGPLLRLAANHLAPSAVFAAGMIGLVVSFVMFAVEHPIAPFVGAVLFAVGNGLAWPTFQARLADAALPEDQGAVQGAATSAGSLASILGLVVGGLLYPSLGVGLFVSGAVLFAMVAVGTPAWFGRSGGSPTSE